MSEGRGDGGWSWAVMLSVAVWSACVCLVQCWRLTFIFKPVTLVSNVQSSSEGWPLKFRRRFFCPHTVQSHQESSMVKNEHWARTVRCQPLLLLLLLLYPYTTQSVGFNTNLMNARCPKMNVFSFFPPQLYCDIFNPLIVKSSSKHDWTLMCRKGLFNCYTCLLPCSNPVIFLM